MKQRLSMQQEQQSLRDQCDFGIIPRTHTTYRLDLVLTLEGTQPAVILERKGFPPFQILFDPENVSLRDWQNETTVHLSQEDVDLPELYVVVWFKGRIMERTIFVEEMKPFLAFPYEYGDRVVVYSENDFFGL